MTQTAASAFDFLPLDGEKSDTVDLPAPVRAIECLPAAGGGAAGTLRVTTPAGQVRNTYIEPGQLRPIPAVRVHNSGTTATGLEGFV